MALDKSNLNKEQRFDKHGRMVTRWVKGPNPNGETSSALANAAKSPRVDHYGHDVQRHIRHEQGETGEDKPASDGSIGTTAVLANINWETFSPARASSIVEQVVLDLKDPDKLWRNFDFLTGMLESKHSDIAIDAMQRNHAAATLRDTWLKKHGVTARDRDTYTKIGGDEGYESYKETYDHMMRAGVDALARAEAKSAAAPAPANDLTFKEKVEDRVVDVSDNFGEKVDSANEVLESIGDEFADRYNGDAPTGVEGTTTSWSDLNPFKGWGRKK